LENVLLKVAKYTSIREKNKQNQKLFYMPARLIAIPFLILTAVFGYLTLEKNDIFSYFLLVFMIALALIYTFSPQINYAAIINKKFTFL